MKIAIVVQGRFHAFDLARALLDRGHAVTLFTNYPGWAVERFGISRRHVRSFTLHGALVRILGRLSAARWWPAHEALLHTLFGRWAAVELAREPWDVIHCFSGISEELLRVPELASIPRLLMRGSAHIRAQARLLAEEEQRTGHPLDRPTPWMLAREEREYQLADQIIVLSSFAQATFVAEGVAPERVTLVPLGVDTAAFRPIAQIVEQRSQRILAGEPLRVLYVGALSLQKGMWDLAQIVASVDPQRFAFQLIGAPSPEIRPLLPRLQRHARLLPRQPHNSLPGHYSQADMFLFPTIQDGFAVVVTQALASALPIITTLNCSGPDCITEGATGWIVPIRAPEACIERLQWCDTHRHEVAAMVRRSYAEFQPRDWSAVAADFERVYAEIRVKDQYATH